MILNHSLETVTISQERQRELFSHVKYDKKL